MADYIDVYRKEARKSVTTQMEGTSITLHPEYLLTYLVHVLAHHPVFPVTSSEHAHPLADDYFFRELLFIIWALVHQEEGRAEGGKKEDLDNLPAILAILRSIKNAEDLVDNSKTDRLYAICDIAIMIAKEVGRKKMFSGDYTRDIPLPATLYKVPAAVGGNATAVKVDGSHLPPCFGEKDVLTRLKIGISFRSCQVLFHGSLRDDTGIILCCNSISSSFLSLSIVCVVICSEQI